MFQHRTETWPHLEALPMLWVWYFKVQCNHSAIKNVSTAIGGVPARTTVRVIGTRTGFICARNKADKCIYYDSSKCWRSFVL